MTRPMPGPPGGFTDYARLNYALLGKKITYEQYQEFGAALRMAFTARPKHLTAEGCAAHYWQAEADEMVHLYTWHDSDFRDEEADDAYAHIRATWRRFKDTPHALEIGGAAS